METLYKAFEIIGYVLMFPLAIIFIGIFGNIIMLIDGLLFDKNVIKETFFYEIYASLKEKFIRRKQWKRLEQKCKNCGGTNIEKSEVVHERIADDSKYKEKVLKCADCGHTIYEHWPQYW